MITTHSLKITALVMLITLSVATFAQQKSLTRANQLFDEKSYVDAIEKYERILKKNKNNSTALKKIAECYRLNNNTAKAEVYYAQLVESKNASSEEVLHYIQTLFSNGNYTKAKEVLTSPLAPSDSRTANYLKGLNNLKEYYKDSASVKVKLETALNSEGNDFSPVLTKNSVLFTSSRPRTQWVKKEHSWSNKVYNVLYIAKKQGTAFEAVKPFAKEYSSNYNDGPACFSSDGKKIIFTANSMAENRKPTKRDIVKLQLFTASYNADDNDYEGLEAFAYNNDGYNCAHPALSSDGMLLVFSSDMPGTLGGMDLWQCKWEGSKWAKPENLGDKINSPGNEVFPTLGVDGTLYFSSNGRDGLGGLDLYSATSTSGNWAAASNMNAPFNSSKDDFGITLEKDAKTGYFSSNRASAKGDDDIFSFSRDKVNTTKNFLILVKDAATKKLIESELQYKDFKTGTVHEQKGNGKYMLSVTPETELEFLAKATKYQEKSLKTKLSTDSIELFLNAEDKNCINGIVLDKSNNGTPAQDATVIIKDNAGTKVFETITGSDGKYSKCDLDKDKSYTVTTSKKGGYFTKTEGIKIPATEVKTTELEKIVVGKAIKIDNIYFDLGKADIRNDAANELDKTVLLLNDNPDIIVELSSHTDCRGSAASNLALSESRAKSSVAYIIAKGINKKRISGRGYGESKLTNSCACEGAVKSTCSEQEHQQNRRTEFKVTGFAK